MRPSIIDALGNDELHKVVDSMDADLLAPVSGVCRFLQSLVQLVNSWRSVLHAKAHRVPLDLWANREELDAFFAQPIDQVALCRPRAHGYDIYTWRSSIRRAR